MTTQYKTELEQTIRKVVSQIPAEISEKVSKVGEYAFYNCSSLTSIDFPRCKEVRQGAFWDCEKLESVNLPTCNKISYGFSSNKKLTSINLPACTNLNSLAFQDNSQLASIHFSWRNKTAITALSGYSNKFGATSATIYFDLEAAPMTLSDFSEVTYIIDGSLVTDNDVQDGNVYIIIPEETHSITAYKAGYCVVIDSITVVDETAFTYTPVWTTAGTTYTIDASSAPTGTPIIKFKYGGAEITSISGTTGSIIVPAGVTIEYEVTLDGYKKIKDTLTSSVDTTVTVSNWEEQTYVTYDMRYPFTGYDSVLANLVDDNNFTVAESPTPYNSRYNTMSSSIISGAKTFSINSSYAYGYIKFHTPPTTDTNLLTVSVTCNAYAESSYDVGFVYIDTTLHEITSNVRPSTSSGNTDSTYGYMLYNSRGKSTATYSTYTKVLEADTDYYLQFAYTKDSSSSYYWDRLSITNIKFTDMGTY